MNRYLYSLLLYLILPLIIIRLLLRSYHIPAYRKRLKERFACGPSSSFQKGGIWLHAVSVGESIAAAPLIKKLQQQYPLLPITVTCTTPTGSERIYNLFGNTVQHCYLAYDLPNTASRFISHIEPVLAIIMETELWPNHIYACNKRNIPIIIANARLSARSAKGYAKFPMLTRPMLSKLSVIAAQTNVEAERFIRLGASKEAVLVTGSIKFDIEISDKLSTDANFLREKWTTKNRFTWIAASTHAGEDELILDAHKSILKSCPNALLILVPRHPERFNSVYELCVKAGLNTVRRSSSLDVELQHNVLLGDSMGELMTFYSISDVAFVGGSLTKQGGHNLLEPAAVKLPILSGPYTFNFLEISNHLRNTGALIIVKNSSDIAETVLSFFRNEQFRTKCGLAALHTMKENKGALNLLIKEIRKILNKKTS